MIILFLSGPYGRLLMRKNSFTLLISAIIIFGAVLPRMLFAGGEKRGDLPPDFPAYNITELSGSSDQPIFWAPFHGYSDPGYISVLDKSGIPIYYNKLPKVAYDFKLQPNGRLSYFLTESVNPLVQLAYGTYYVLDETYNVVDTYQCGNGYADKTDMHDFLLPSDGSAYLFSYEEKKMNMSKIVPGGQIGAKVYGLIIQKLDQSKNVEFQWSSWTHFSVTDSVEDLTAQYIDYVHGNSLDLLEGGDLLLSCRNMNEITRIDGATGDIVWRLGLNAKHNDFTFVNDTRGFSHQHHVRYHGDGRLTIFDNGNDLVPEYSSACEYILDENARTCTLVSRTRHNPDLYGQVWGSDFVTESGNFLVNWGDTGTAAITEYSSSGDKVFELLGAEALNNYRAFQFNWNNDAVFALDTDRLFLLLPAGESSISAEVTVTNNLASSLSLTGGSLQTSDFTVDTDFPITIPSGGVVALPVSFMPADPLSGPFTDILSLNSDFNTLTQARRIAQLVHLRGEVPGGEIGIFRPSSGLWAIKDQTRVYFGSSADLPFRGDYDGDGVPDLAIYRGSSGLWAVRGVTRVYYGGSADTPVPSDYDGDGVTDIGVFRPATGLWAIREVTRAYFGREMDDPIPADYSGDGTSDPGLFRESSGLWAIRGVTRIYFGTDSDQPLPRDYNGDGAAEIALFRPVSGLWAIRNLSRFYFGGGSDRPVPADYAGTGTADIGIFRPTSGLWAIADLTRCYFGGGNDIPVPR